MANKFTFSEKCSIGYALIDIGYRDYIAARFLLNNNFVLQGVTLASTAIEKYLKALIVFSAEEKEKYHLHFDNFKKLKALLAKYNCDITEKLDPVFIDILEKAFKIRYYDKLNKPIFMGFYVNQFIGELDDTIYLLETVTLKTQDGETPYRRALKKKDPNLYDNNFTLTNQTKKEFMEKPSAGFSIYIITGSVLNIEKITTSSKIVNQYNGAMAIYNEF